MRKHGSIHLFIAGMIAGFSRFSCCTWVGGAGKAARQSCRRLWFYGRRRRALVVAKETKLFEKRQAEGSSKLQSRIMPLFLELARR